jgi:hypothetical protein
VKLGSAKPGIGGSANTGSTSGGNAQLLMVKPQG